MRQYKLVRFIGRLLIVSLLVTHAVVNIRAPSLSPDKQIIKSIQDLLLPNPSNAGHSTAQIQNPNQSMIRFVGFIQALTSVMVIFGDYQGGIVFAAQMALILAFRIHETQTSKPGLFNILGNTEIHNSLTLIGLGILLSDTSKSTRIHRTHHNET